MPVAFKMGKITDQLRREPLPVPTPVEDRIPAETAKAIITSVKTALPKNASNKVLAQHSLNIFETLNAFFFSSIRRHTRLTCDWSSDVCSSDLADAGRHRDARVGAAEQHRVRFLDIFAREEIRLRDAGLDFASGRHAHAVAEPDGDAVRWERRSRTADRYRQALRARQGAGAGGWRPHEAGVLEHLR